MNHAVYYCLPVYKSEQDADNDIFYVKIFETWEDAFCGTYDECCDFMYGKELSYQIPLVKEG